MTYMNIPDTSTYLRGAGFDRLRLQIPDQPNAATLARTATELVEIIKCHQGLLDSIKNHDEDAINNLRHHNRMIKRCKELLAELSEL